jgi:hypothetical protein
MNDLSAALAFAPASGRASLLDLRPSEPELRRRRARLWELNAAVHCSVVGTCLTTAELRRVMTKVLPNAAALGDHDLHSAAVGLCHEASTSAKLLQKALDQRHETAIKRFARLQGEAAVLETWAEARRSGDIPGAYWAVLTHPDLELEGMRKAFGDVHMLSHLVGAANRADIRRLTALEEENQLLRAKVERQQLRLHDEITSRDARIQRLESLAAGRAPAVASDGGDAAALRELAAGLQARLEAERARSERLERRLAQATDARTRAEQRADREAALREALLRETELLERRSGEDGEPAVCTLAAERILYVGGRPSAVAQMRAALEAAGGALLHHDGGRDDHQSLLPGLIGQADRVAFPVDCVSHDAALTVKRICRRLGKPWLPLRSSGFASFLAAVSG